MRMPEVRITTNLGIATDGAPCYEAIAHEQQSNGDWKQVVRDDGTPLEPLAGTKQGAINRLRLALSQKFPDGWTQA